MNRIVCGNLCSLPVPPEIVQLTFRCYLRVQHVLPMFKVCPSWLMSTLPVSQLKLLFEKASQEDLDTTIKQLVKDDAVQLYRIVLRYVDIEKLDSTLLHSLIENRIAILKEWAPLRRKTAENILISGMTLFSTFCSSNLYRCWRSKTTPSYVCRAHWV